jgi:hypothetical protein
MRLLPMLAMAYTYVQALRVHGHDHQGSVTHEDYLPQV